MTGTVCGSTTLSMAAEQKKTYSDSDLKRMAAIIYCEAGNQSYAGKLAVGIVVMNRKRSSSFPNTVSGVLKQRRQFTPVATGKWSKERSVMTRVLIKKEPEQSA